MTNNTNNDAESISIDAVLFNGVREEITLPADWQRCYNRISGMRNPSVLEFFIKLYYWFDYIAEGQHIYDENLPALSEALQTLTGCATSVANECVKQFHEVYEAIVAYTNDGCGPSITASIDVWLRIHAGFLDTLGGKLAKGSYSECVNDVLVVVAAVLFPNLNDEDFNTLIRPVLGDTKPISAF